MVNAVRAAERRRPGEAPGAGRAEVGLRRPRARHPVADRHRDGRSGRLTQQFSDPALGLRVGTLAEVGVADVAFAVDQVLGRPIPVAVGVPGREVVVEAHRVGDLRSADSALHVRGQLFEGELGRVHADDDQAAVAVAVVPRVQVGLGALAVDAAVGPEVHQDDLAPQPGQGERLGVHPLRDSDELGGRPGEDFLRRDLLHRVLARGGQQALLHLVDPQRIEVHQPSLDVLVQAGDDGQPDQHEQGRDDPGEPSARVAGPAKPVQQRPAGQGDGEQRHADTQAVEGQVDHAGQRRGRQDGGDRPGVGGAATAEHRAEGRPGEDG